MGAVARFVQNVGSAIGGAVSKVVGFVAKTVVGTIQGAIKNPLKTIATIAAYALAPATGGLSLTIGLPLISAVDTIAHGGSLMDAALNAGASVIGNFVADSSFVTGALKDTFGAGVAKDMIQGAIRGGVTAGVKGDDIASAALGSGLSAGAGSLIGDFGVKDYLGASLGAGAGYFASNALTNSLRGGLQASLKGKSFEEGAAQGASSGMLSGFMDNLSNLGGSAQSYFGDLYKSQVEPLYNAQVELQKELTDRGTALQEAQDEYRSAYDTYNASATKTQEAGDSYTAKAQEFNDLKSQYDAAVASGNTEEADRLSVLANAKADEANKVYDTYAGLEAEHTKNETAVTDLQNKYLKGSEELKQGVLTYQDNLGKLKEASDPLAKAQEKADSEWWKESAGTGAVTDEQKFGDGTSITVFDDGSQIITQKDGTKVVYNDDGTVFTPGEQPEGTEVAPPINSEAIKWGKALFSAGAGGARPAPTNRSQSPGQRTRPSGPSVGGTSPGRSAPGAPGIAGAGIAGAGIAGAGIFGGDGEAGAQQAVASAPGVGGSPVRAGNTNYDLGYETEYGKGLNKTKTTAIPGITAATGNPEEQYLSFEQEVPSNRRDEQDSEQSPFKRGGIVSRETIAREAPMFMRGRSIKGAGDGTSDDIPGLVVANKQGGQQKEATPILVARDEFIIPASAVSAIGNGSSDSGAERLNKFVEAVLSHKKGKGDGNLPPDAKEIHQYFRGGLA